MPLFTVQRRVEFAETDMAGIVHFAKFFVYLEEAEHALFRSFGTSIMEKQPNGTVVSWPRVAAACSYDAPAFYGDVLDLRLEELQIGNRSLTMQWEVFRDGDRLCTGELKTVCCAFRPGEKMTSIDIPASLREKLEALCKNP